MQDLLAGFLIWLQAEWGSGVFSSNVCRENGEYLIA